MKYSFFTVPLHSPQQAGAELNAFLDGHRIVGVEKRCIENGENSYWTFCVEWLEHEGLVGKGGKTKAKVDYRKILSEDDFASYVKLRELRKELAEQAGVPPYVVFTNEQLADIVRGCLTTKASLQELKGVGSSRIEKYGAQFLSLMRDIGSKMEANEENSD